MKVVFLDIDGVLVTVETVRKNLHYGEESFNPFHPEAVRQLNRVLEETGAEIVVSSSWRCDGPRWDALMDHFAAQGVCRRPIGRTPFLERKSGGGVWVAVQRGEEIKAWLSQDVEAYAVVDDDSDMDAVRDHFVHVKNGMYRGGLGPAHAEQMIALLGRKAVA